ncbi:MAG: type II toxin-antitoxin system YafQ family toxin [Calditrichia bacterium]
MLKVVVTGQFKKDIRKSLKQGKAVEALLTVMGYLIHQQPLPENFKDHPLVGDLVGRRDCHLQPDLLLIYRVEGERLILERMGNHSELFRK